MRRRLISIFIILSIALTQSGCQLLLLPLYVIAVAGRLIGQVLAIALVLPFRLLPLAAKYAPLALMFLEKTDPTQTFYVSLPKGAGGLLRAEYFVDHRGKEMAVMMLPSASLEGIGDGEVAAITEAGLLLLTEWEHKDVSLAELKEVWQRIGSRPGEIWVVGPAAERIRREDETFMV